MLEVEGAGEAEVEATAGPEADADGATDGSGAEAGAGPDASAGAPVATTGGRPATPSGYSGPLDASAGAPDRPRTADASPGAPDRPRTADASAGAPVTGRLRSVVVPRPEGRKPTATPSVRRRAREAGIDLRAVPGTGPAGRITHEDLDELFRSPTGRGGVPGRPATGPTRAPDPSTADEPIIGLRRRIAEHMVASASTIPHITYVEEVDMTALEDLRATLNGSAPIAGDGAAGPAAPRLTILPFLVRALVRVLPRFPLCNAHVVDDGDAGDGPATLRTFGGVHVGIATQTDRGLVVPVLRHAEAETLWGTAERVADLAEAARTGQASAADLTGSTITITSLGALGGLVTTPIINKPETTVVGVNKLVTRPVWDGERFAPRQMMNLSSSFDHRVVDGWDAATFVQALKSVLEQPALLFVEEPA